VNLSLSVTYYHRHTLCQIFIKRGAAAPLRRRGNISFALLQSMTVVRHLPAQINFYLYFPFIFAYFCDFQWKYPSTAVLRILNVVNIVVKSIQI
jgi:hypothetical protein